MKIPSAYILCMPTIINWNAACKRLRHASTLYNIGLY